MSVRQSVARDLIRSGAMYANLPLSRSAFGPRAIECATPKSRIFVTPVNATITLLGLRSQWITPWS